MDSRLPDAPRRRYQSRVRQSTDRLGVVVVCGAAAVGLVWVGGLAPLDLRAVAALPPSLGFTMFSGHPPRGRSGFLAPLFADAPRPLGCDPARATFELGLADLKLRLGPVMGDPLECERAVDAAGDTAQLTTTGIAAYLQRSQTLTFSDGSHSWTLSGGNLTIHAAEAGDRRVP